MLQIKLKVVGGKQSGKMIPLISRKFLIGREEDCQLRPNSELVSRHHCVFTLDGYTLRLRDLGSTNGTFVNGERIRTVTNLQNGDHVAVGKLDFEVLLIEVPEEAAVPQVTAAAESQPVPTETAELSSSDTVHDLPADQVIGGQPPNAGDTTIISPQQLPAYPQQPLAQPGAPLHPGAEYPQAPASYPQQPAVGYPQQPVGYPQQPVPYPAAPPPAGYPLLQQPLVPYMQPQPGVPYPQPGIYPQVPVGTPQPDSGGAVPDLPVKLPDPNASQAAPTGQQQPQPGGDQAQTPPEQNPADMAADIIKNYIHRRPDQ